MCFNVLMKWMWLLAVWVHIVYTREWERRKKIIKIKSFFFVSFVYFIQRLGDKTNILALSQ